MATQKVKTLKRTLAYTSVYNAGVLTVTTPVHNLKNGDLVTLINASSPQELVDVSVTVTSTTEFTIANTKAIDFTQGTVVIKYFSAGQTGIQDTFTIAKTIDAPSIVQFTAHGAGGAVIILSASNDGFGWVPIATITLASSDLATDFVSIAPNWVQARLTITSIGASTTVVVTSSV